MLINQKPVYFCYKLTTFCISNMLYIYYRKTGCCLTGIRFVFSQAMTEKEPEDREDPMARVFPKVTKCTFHKFGPSGTVEVTYFMEITFFVCILTVHKKKPVGILLLVL